VARDGSLPEIRQIEKVRLSDQGGPANRENQQANPPETTWFLPLFSTYRAGSTAPRRPEVNLSISSQTARPGRMANGSGGVRQAFEHAQGRRTLSSRSQAPRLEV